MVFVDEATVGADLLEASGDPMITTPINAPTCVEEVGATRPMTEMASFCCSQAKVH